MDTVSSGFSGKGLVVIITIIFSSLSFTLGYAVGRFGAPHRPESPAQSPEPAAITQPPPQQVPPAPSVTPDAPATLKEGSAADAQSVEQAPPAEGPSAPAGNVSRQPARQVKEVAKTTLEEKDLTPAPAKDEPLFTVQIGAFKNKSEAERLKAKYSRKGYKIVVEAVKSGGNTKVYKVRTGEFAGRKDAELLAIKLKKSEGLNAFVAPVRE